MTRFRNVFKLELQAPVVTPLSTPCLQGDEQFTCYLLLTIMFC